MTAPPPGVLGSGPSPIQSPVQSPTQSPVQSPLQSPTGGGPQAIAGAGDLAPILGQLSSTIASLAAILGSSIGGGPGQPPPTATPAPPTGPGLANAAGPGTTTRGTPVSPPSGQPPSFGNVDPATVDDRTGTGGLTPASLRGLEEAHRFGLPLVSGKRSGSGRSDHDHGNAIDVGTLPIGDPASTGATPQMRAFAEYMRQQGAAGQLDVKYVISDGMIASSKDGWAWRPYTAPGQSASSLEALKKSNRGEYNRIQHYDHVHVSFS